MSFPRFVLYSLDHVICEFNHSRSLDVMQIHYFFAQALDLLDARDDLRVVGSTMTFPFYYHRNIAILGDGSNYFRHIVIDKCVQRPFRSHR